MPEDAPRAFPLSSKYTDNQAGAGAGIGFLFGFASLIVLATVFRDLGDWTVYVGLGLLFVLTLVGATISVSRGKAWLEGSTLVMSWMKEHRCDLATADISMDGTRDDWLNGPNIPRLIAHDGHTGVRLRLELRMNNGNLLPPEELRALADAMTAADRPEDSPALRIAGQMRGLADNPLAGEL